MPSEAAPDRRGSEPRQVPEGDTIHAVARALSPELVGQRVVLLEVDKAAVGWACDAIATGCEAVGKHLIVRLAARDGERFVRVHLGMKGSWHRYRAGESWARPAAARRLVIATGRWLFVCFDAKEVELGHGRPWRVARLGPDLLAGPSEAVDLELIVARARGRGGRALGELLLDQGIASGIGNVYKCETLFLAGLDPWRASDTIADDVLAEVYRLALALMRDNLARGGWRTTTGRAAGLVHGEARHWVYRRAGRPCRRCGTMVASRLQGEHARMTYWCGTCQR